jgi:hypothetical protein
MEEQTCARERDGRARPVSDHQGTPNHERPSAMAPAGQ